MIDTITITLNLPSAGSREDYLQCVAKAHGDAIARRDRLAALALAGLLTLVDEGIAFSDKGTPHFFNPAWGRTA